LSPTIRKQTQPTARKQTQRERLLAGMLAVANNSGYAAATVSNVIAHAGVSRPTFYDYFEDRDACFLAVHRDSAERLLAQIREAVAQAPPEQAPQAAIRRLLQRAEAEPEQARFLANETMAGGPRALDERDRTVDEIARIIESARAKLSAKTPSPDLPTRALIGGTHWVLASRLRRGEQDLTTLADELTEWIESYDRPFGKHRWRSFNPLPPPPASPHAPSTQMQPPPPLPTGRSRLSASEIARNQRERILFAVAEVADQKGYSAGTVADITAAAKLDRRVFYSHFKDKQEAFLAAHELAFQKTMTIATNSFFSVEEWPERIWQGIHAIGQFNTIYPITRVIYLESHALGSTAIQRVEESYAAFTIFLQEGNQRASRPIAQTAMEAIVAAGFEIGYYQLRHGKDSPMASPTYHITYLCLAPFLGPDAANDFIDGKLREARTAARGPRTAKTRAARRSARTRT
jgi:AcrR family transcriptional regulator